LTYLLMIDDYICDKLAGKLDGAFSEVGGMGS
jgi:hypothetical protein